MLWLSLYSRCHFNSEESKNHIRQLENEVTECNIQKAVLHSRRRLSRMGSELFCWLLLYAVVMHAASENKPLLSLTDSSASVLARRQGFSQAEQELYQLPVVVWDGGEPLLSSTSTVTLRVCPCQRGARMPVCRAQAFLSSAGLSTGALIAILLCVLILLGKIENSRAKRSACFFPQ